MGSLPEDLRSEEDVERIPCSGFRVKYLGCATFTLRKKRTPKGIASMQRPLLEVYSGARKKGDSQRSTHLFALDQRLDVLEYGLVLAQSGGTSGPRSGSAIDREEDLVLVKVLTPLSNAVLWAAVRFQAKALKRRVLGAAFVPLACCDAVLDRKGFLRLDSKHRFLVSLSHPSVFACVFRRVTDPRSFECHAFACGSAREALALGSALTLVRERCDMPPLTRPPWPPPPQPLPKHFVITGSGPSSTSTTSQRRLQLPPSSRNRYRAAGNRTTESEGDESNSYASVHKFNKHPPSGRRLLTGRRGHRIEADGGGNTSESSASVVRGRRSQRTLFIRRDPIGGPHATNPLNNVTRREDVDDEAGLWMPVVKASSLTEKALDHPDQIGNKKGGALSHPMSREESSTSSANSPASDTSCSAEYLEVGKSRRFNGCVVDSSSSRGEGGGERRDMWTMTEAELEETIDLSSESSSLGVDFEDEDNNFEISNRLLSPPTTGLFTKVKKAASGIGGKTVDAATTTPRETGTDAPVKYTYFGYETYRAPTYVVPTKQKALPDQNDSSNGSNLVEMRREQDELVTTARERRRLLDKASVKHQGTHVSPQPQWDHHHTTSHTTNTKSSAKPAAVIVGNGTGRVTINVPFCKKKSKDGRPSSNNGGGGRSSVASSSTQTDDGSSSVVVLLPPNGVRSFRSDRRVGDWSTMSQTTSEEGVPSILRSSRHRNDDSQASSSSSTYSKTTGHRQHHSTRSRTHRPQKMLRWRSEDRIPAHRSFFWSLKRLSLQSLTKAKHKTGKFISNMRTKLMGTRKSPDGSEDSAYDTAEVCLSPSGKGAHYATTPATTTYYTDDDRVRSSRAGPKAHRQQSWSFHDLREAGIDRSPERRTYDSDRRKVRSVTVSDDESVCGRSSRTSFLRKSKDSSTKRRTRRTKHRRRHSSASDSGVEEYYPSDGSALRKSGSEKTLGSKQVTRVEVHHGMSDDTFHRWSHTNLQEELGYIP